MNNYFVIHIGPSGLPLYLKGPLSYEEAVTQLIDTITTQGITVTEEIRADIDDAEGYIFNDPDSCHAVWIMQPE